ATAAARIRGPSGIDQGYDIAAPGGGTREKINARERDGDTADAAMLPWRRGPSKMACSSCESNVYRLPLSEGPVGRSHPASTPARCSASSPRYAKRSSTRSICAGAGRVHQEPTRHASPRHRSVAGRAPARAEPSGAGDHARLRGARDRARAGSRKGVQPPRVTTGDLLEARTDTKYLFID